MDEDLMLTTVDNPFNPKTDYDKWRSWDIENGYNTEEVLARMTDIPDDVELDDDVTINKLTNDAVQEMLNNDALGIYKLA